jgi:pyrroline-5-carboxylate reductase
MARGWGEPVLCSDSDSGSGRARALVAELGGQALSSREVVERADLVVLCHKPYQLEQVARDVGPTDKPIASVLGATPIEKLQGAYPNSQVFALMPNTPVEVRRGVVIYADRDPDSSNSVDPATETQVLELFERLGTVIRLPKRLLEAAAAVTSVGPAYQALLAEAQVDAAVRHGLSAALAGRLLVETMAGSAELLANRDYDTLAVRREVTSPAGSTARGLDALERAGVRSAFQDAIDAVVRPTGQGGS